MKIARDIGFEKEKEVVAYLKRLKYEILDTNFKTRFGGIDIIAKQDDTIVFIEVKYKNRLLEEHLKNRSHITNKKKS
jgi:Holliday junction resolvase-like predicted endonuclease